MTERRVLVHYHIFKNAGSSVDVALQRSFGPRWAVFEDNHALDFKTSGELAQFLESRPDVCAVSSHHARPPLPFPGCLPIVFLRHPILRARSVYEFIRRNHEQPGCPLELRKTFATFVRWALDSSRDGSGVIRDAQVACLLDPSRSRGLLRSKVSSESLDEVKSYLDGWGIVGFVEDYKRSAERFQAAYGPQIPDLKFIDVRANRTSMRIPDIEQDTASIRDELGDRLYEELVEANRFDFELYDWARRRFPFGEHEGSPHERFTERLRDEIRYLGEEYETLLRNHEQLNAQFGLLSRTRDAEIAEHEALARAHIDMIKQHDVLLQLRNNELTRYEALACAHVESVKQYNALLEIRDRERAEYEALARAHNDLKASFDELSRFHHRQS